MAFRLPPPPQSNDLKGPAWQDWFYKLAAAFTTLKSVVWNAIDFTGSNLTDIQIRNHNDLQNIQGGAPGDYQHLTTAQVASIGTGGGGKASGTPVFFADDSEPDWTPIPGGIGPQGTPGAQGVRGSIGFGLDGEDGQDGMAIPGVAGAQGQPGATGLTGAIGLGLDGQDGEDGMSVPGVRGASGSPGAQGNPGIPGIGLDGEDGQDGQSIPGSTGAPGLTGSTGAQGPVGPAIFLEAEQLDEPMIIPGPPGPSGSGGSSIAAWVLPFAAAHG